MEFGGAGSAGVVSVGRGREFRRIGLFYLGRGGFGGTLPFKGCTILHHFAPSIRKIRLPMGLV